MKLQTEELAPVLVEEWGRRKACGIATLNAQRLVEIEIARA
jgi:hypothetical protein